MKEHSLGRTFACLLSAIVFSLGANHSASAGPQSSVAYQISPNHAGEAAAGTSVKFPLKKLWTAQVGGAPSYPLIADGKVIVTSVSASGGNGTDLTAFDANTGAIAWGPIALDGTYFWSAAAYDNGKVFVVNFDGLLRAYSSASGAALWSIQLPGQYAFSSPPTAVDGKVFVGGAGSGGTLYAVDQQTGAVLWTQSVQNGDNSSPAVADGGVYVSYACPQSYRFDETTGAPVWHYSGSCEGGGGETAVYRNGRVYVRDAYFDTTSGLVLDALNGNKLGGFNASLAPAVGDTDAFLSSDSGLQGVTLPTMSPIWNFAPGSSLQLPPVLIDQYVFTASSAGLVYALDRKSGQLVWSDKLGAGINNPGGNVSAPAVGFGVGDGLFVVPTSQSIVAYRVIQNPTPPPTVSLKSSVTSGVVGGTTTLTWSATAATSCNASGDWTGPLALSGSKAATLSHKGTNVFTLTCSGSGGSTAKSVSVSAPSETPPPTLTLTADSSSVVVGAGTTLAWGSSNAANCSSSGAWSGSRPTAGTAKVTISAMGANVFTLSCQGAGGKVTQSVTVDGILPTVSFTKDKEDTAKGNLLGKSTNVISVQLSQPSPKDVTVYFKAGGTESALAYTVSPSASLTIPAGSLVGNITVDVYGSKIVCGNTITLTLQQPTNGRLGAITSNILTVKNPLTGSACTN